MPPKLLTPDYWQTACKELARQDAVLKELIKTHRGQSLQSRGDPFYCMMRALVGQQISVKAADTIWKRLEDRVGRVTPSALAKLKDNEIRAFGFSERKVEYARTLQDFFPRRNTLHYWDNKEDEDVIAELVALRGVGRWTAEMFLIFCLLRPNHLPIADIGLLKAIGKHYHRNEHPSTAQLDKHRQRWDPWNSVATWYMWRSLDPVAVEY
mgnify:FL=1